MAACDPLEIPPVVADNCDPDINFGQVEKIFFTNDGNPFTNWALLTEWTARLDNTDITDDSKIRFLNVIGDVPAPEKTEITISLGRKVYAKAKRTVNIRVDETGDDNYEFAKWLEENQGATLRVWYTAGKYLYGGNNGIMATIMLDDVVPESVDELNTLTGTIKWDGPMPERVINPMA